MADYLLVFNSGSTATEFMYTNSDKNVEYMKITNSDQSNYQSADFSLSRVDPNNEMNIKVNTTVKLWIDDSLEFDGYINRIGKTIRGVKHLAIQCVGKTYDLWRFNTSSNVLYENVYSSYIVSSLVNAYGSGSGHYVYPPVIANDQGALINNVTFDKMALGDCIARMSQMDGYKFYVGTDNVLQYYLPDDTPQFTVVESDIINMSPNEISDDSMRNDVIVIGDLQYENESGKLDETELMGYFRISSEGYIVAQGLSIPNNLHNNRLSSIKLYAAKSTGNYAISGVGITKSPPVLTGDVRKTWGTSPSSGVIPSSNEISFSSGDLSSPPNWFPYFTFNDPDTFNLSSNQLVWTTFQSDSATSGACWKLGYGQYGTYMNDYTEGNIVPNVDIDGTYGGVYWRYPNSSSILRRYELYNDGTTPNGFLSIAHSAAYSMIGQPFMLGLANSGNRIRCSGMACLIASSNTVNNSDTFSYAIYELNSSLKPVYPELVYKSLTCASLGKPVGVSNNNWVWIGWGNYVNLEVMKPYLLVVSSSTAGVIYWSSNSTLANYPSSSLLKNVGNDWVKQNQSCYFKMSGIQLPFDYGNAEYNPTTKRISFKAMPVGNSINNYFQTYLGSQRILEYGLSGGGLTSDTFSFLVSCNIYNYDLPTKYGGYYSDSLDRYRPRLMMGIFDPTSPNDYDYHPIIGFEFDLGGITTSSMATTTDDSYVIEDYPTTNWNGPGVFYGHSIELNAMRSLVKLALPRLSGATVLSAKLYFNLYSYEGTFTDNTVVVDIHRNTSDFVEETVTWNTKPSYYATQTASDYLHNHSGWIYYDVTNDIRAFVAGTYSNFGWTIKLHTESGDYAGAYDSWESGSPRYQPYLQVEYVKKQVRPFIAKNITTSATDQYHYGSWATTGSKSYKCELVGTNMKFYIDEVLNQTWGLSSYTLQGNYKFGVGNTYDWSGFRIILIDTASGATNDQVVSSMAFGYISGEISLIELTPSQDEYVSISSDYGATWVDHTDKFLLYGVGWNYDYVYGEASDEDSIINFGKHFYTTTESLITNYIDADNYAQSLVDTYKSGVEKGDIIINGITGINLGSKFTLDLDNMDVSRDYVISQYAQTLDKNGFQTQIYYGEAPYDIARIVSQLQSSVYGGNI